MSPALHSSEAKDLIISNMLRHVPEHGWTIEALRLAVVDTGYGEGDEYRVFSGNIDRVIEYYLTMIDRQMEDRLNEIDLSSMRIKDRVATAIMVRLHLLEDHKESVQKSLTYLATPIRNTIAMKSLYNTVNSIWYAAGDNSTDFNFYTKRTLLGGVYSATLIYWLKDTSEGAISTRAYLSRRLDQVMMIPKIKSTLGDGVSMMFKAMGCK